MPRLLPIIAYYRNSIKLLVNYLHFCCLELTELVSFYLPWRNLKRESFERRQQQEGTLQTMFFSTWKSEEIQFMVSIPCRFLEGKQIKYFLLARKPLTMRTAVIVLVHCVVSLCFSIVKVAQQEERNFHIVPRFESNENFLSFDSLLDALASLDFKLSLNQ